MQNLVSRNTPQSLTSICINKFLALDLPPRELIMAPWLPTQGLTMIYAPRGVGKTHVSLGIAYAVASGTPFLGWDTPKPRGVLFVDGEMPGNTLQERLSGIIKNNVGSISKPLEIVTPDLQEKGIPDLASLEGQDTLNRLVNDDIDLIILDNLSTLVRSGKENEAESWAPIQDWALGLRTQGKSVLFIHHSGKGGQQRGTSRREDVLDTVIALKHPSDYTPEHGALFEVHYEKARGICGEEVAPFRAQLRADEDSQEWNIQLLDDSNYEKIINLLNEDISQCDIAKELNVHKSLVSKYKRRATEEGRVITGQG